MAVKRLEKDGEDDCVLWLQVEVPASRGEKSVGSSSMDRQTFVEYGVLGEGIHFTHILWMCKFLWHELSPWEKSPVAMERI